MSKAAILVDGGFFLKRYSKIYPNGKTHSAEEVAKNLITICFRHLETRNSEPKYNLYRIFYYDCPPFEKKVHHPLTKQLIDYSKTEEHQFRISFFTELRRQRKVALRLGYLRDGHAWKVHGDKLKELLNQKIKVSDLLERDIHYDMSQKGTDIKIGIDIASLAYKKLVEKIILISGDGDFVPAAKLARREGIDFVLDPLWNNIDDNLHEHIDGLRSVVPKPGSTPNNGRMQQAPAKEIKKI